MKTTTIEFDTEINVPGTTPLRKRRILIRRNNIQQARKCLVETGAESGEQWEFKANIVETLNDNGELLSEYTDKFSVIV